MADTGPVEPSVLPSPPHSAVQHRAEQGIQHRYGLKLPVSVNASVSDVNDYWSRRGRVGGGAGH